MDERRTWMEWDSIAGTGIIDPDGFRNDPSPDGLYTRDEFDVRVEMCTRRFNTVPPLTSRQRELVSEGRCPECGERYEGHLGPTLSCPRGARA